MSTTPGEHTPGPWRVDETIQGCRHVEAKDRFGNWKYICQFVHGGNKEEAHANAKLIAASSDLLAAAKAALAVIVSLDIYKVYGPVIAQLRDAIGRAER